MILSAFPLTVSTECQSPEDTKGLPWPWAATSEDCAQKPHLTSVLVLQSLPELHYNSTGWQLSLSHADDWTKILLIQAWILRPVSWLGARAARFPQISLMICTLGWSGLPPPGLHCLGSGEQCWLCYHIELLAPHHLKSSQTSLLPCMGNWNVCPLQATRKVWVTLANWRWFPAHANSSLSTAGLCSTRLHMKRIPAFDLQFTFHFPQ